MRYVFDLTNKGCCTLYSICHIELFMYSTGTSNSLVYAQDNRIGCSSKLVQHYPKQNVCVCCFASILQQRVSVFRLNQNERKNKQNSLIESKLWYFFQKILGCVSLYWFVSKQFVSVVSLLYRNREFRCFD